MNASTEKLLYLLYWNWDRFLTPTWHTVGESFEGWAYRRGFTRSLAALERRQFIESRGEAPKRGRSRFRSERSVRLTELGRLHALGGRDPVTQWNRDWDRQWRTVTYDLPAGEGTIRNRLRNRLRSLGFGLLQRSHWVRPDPLPPELAAEFRSAGDVQSLAVWDRAVPLGWTDAEIVAGAWDFSLVAERYERYFSVLERRPDLAGGNPTDFAAFQSWLSEEVRAWSAAVKGDPLLPKELLPRNYLGMEAWRRKLEAFSGLEVFPGTFGQ